MALPSPALRMLASKLEQLMYWRREKADDGLEWDTLENDRAIVELRLLFEAVSDVDESWQGECAAKFSDHFFHISWGKFEEDALNDYLRGIGFHHFPGSAEELCQGILRAARVTEDSEVAS